MKHYKLVFAFLSIIILSGLVTALSASKFGDVNVFGWVNLSNNTKNLTVAGAVIAGDFKGNGSLLTNVPLTSKIYWSNISDYPSLVSNFTFDDVSVSWDNLTGYPASCPTGYYVSQIDDNTTCTQALKADGDNATGSYGFEDLVVAKNFTGNVIYGEMYIPNSSNATTFGAANVWYNITHFLTGNMNGVNHEAGKMTIYKEGVYLVNYGVSFYGGANDNYRSAVSVNGISQANCETLRKLGASGDVGSASTNCLLSLAVNDELQFVMRNDDNSNDPTIADSNVVITRVGN